MEYLQYLKQQLLLKMMWCFKPYYKWNTFNTCWDQASQQACYVLNLIINGIPSILGVAIKTLAMTSKF